MIRLRIAPVALICLVLMVVAVAAVFAWDPVSVSAAPGAPDYSVNTDTLPGPKQATGSDLQKILQIIFGILGALSLLMVTIGGLRYVASDGDPQAAGRAKGTILFAIIGLVVAVCGVAIVTFVLGRI